MASKTSKVDQYKLDAELRNDTVVHTTRMVAGKRIAVPRMAWKRERKLGEGGFGVVWLEKEEGSGELRAVKVLSKLQVHIREVEAMIELQDVSFHSGCFPPPSSLTGRSASHSFRVISWLVRRSSCDPHHDGVYRPW